MFIWSIAKRIQPEFRYDIKTEFLGDQVKILVLNISVLFDALSHAVASIISHLTPSVNVA